MQRAIYAALHGDFAVAIQYNVGLLVSIPIILLYAFAEFTRKRFHSLYLFLNSRGVLIGLIVVAFAWWILRNVLDM